MIDTAAEPAAPAGTVAVAAGTVAVALVIDMAEEQQSALSEAVVVLLLPLFSYSAEQVVVRPCVVVEQAQVLYWP